MMKKMSIFAMAVVMTAAASMTFWPLESIAATEQTCVCGDKCACPEGKCECGEACTCTEACRKACATSCVCLADKCVCTEGSGTCATKAGKPCSAPGKSCVMTSPRTACCAR